MERASPACSWLLTMCACLIMASCASITATDNTLNAAPVPSITLSATEVDRFFSRFTSSLAVKSATLNGTAAAVTANALPPSGMTYTYSFAPTAAPFRDGDVLVVVWQGDTTAGSVEATTTNRFANATLKVETPWAGLNPGETGKVCVQFVDAASKPVTMPTAVQVTLSTTVFPGGGLTPTTLTVPAGASRPTVAANLTANAFACPGMGSNVTFGFPYTPPCTAAQGVMATANFGGSMMTACEPTGGTCCGVNGHHCGGPPPPPSICP